MKLLENEKVLVKGRPHFVSLYRLYLIWLFFLIVAITFIVKREEIINSPRAIPLIRFLGDYLGDKLYIFLWGASIMVPAILIAIFRVGFKWVFWFVLVTAAGIYLHYRYGGRYENIENGVLIVVSLVGIIGTELYRYTLSYVVTDFRIVTRSSGLLKQERTLLFTKINDLMLIQPFLGRIFNFGTVIPITASGIATGGDAAAAGMIAGGKISKAGIAFAAGGSKSITVPREVAAYTLYGISKPKEVYNTILELMK